MTATGYVPEPADRSAPAGSLDKLFTHVRALVVPELQRGTESLVPTMRTAAGYHLGWCDENGVPCISYAGKGIRPALALLASRAVGGTDSQALPAAAAVELMHSGGLLQDDVIDGDRSRRRRPAVWTRFGPPTAILTGDALFFVAARLLSASPPPLGTTGRRWMDDTMLRMINGAHMDTDLTEQDEVTLDDCRELAAAKTAGLLSFACALGALAGGGTPRQVDDLRGFGHHLGVAFQHVDDLMDIWGDPARTGKPRGSDLRTRAKSLPVVAALTSGTAAGRQLAALYRQNTVLSDEDVVTATGLIEATGARAWTSEQAESHVSAALACLHAAEPRPDAATLLIELAHLITRRDH